MANVSNTSQQFHLPSNIHVHLRAAPNSTTEGFIRVLYTIPNTTGKDYRVENKLKSLSNSQAFHRCGILNYL